MENQSGDGNLVQDVLSNKSAKKNVMRPIVKWVVGVLLSALFLYVVLFLSGVLYSILMRPALHDIIVWYEGPVRQFERDLVSPFGHGEDKKHTNLDELKYYSDMPKLLLVLGSSPVEIKAIQQESRKKLSENLFQSLDAVKQDGFIVLTKLEAITPPSSMKPAHERVISCVNYKIESANSMIVFLDTGEFGNPPKGSCDFFGESLRMISDYIK